MQTKLGETGKLSNRQLTRLGGLIAMVCGRMPYDHILDDLVENGFAEPDGDRVMTARGAKELVRLSAMAGLRPEQYSSSAK